MSENRRLLSGRPVPDDWSHTEIDPSTGMQKDYIVLSEEERAKGFVKPVRQSYRHTAVCDSVTTMTRALAETYARNPRFYSGTFCATCRGHFPLNQFEWPDGEPMDPDQQENWQENKKKALEEANSRRDAIIEQSERAELARLKAKYEKPAEG